MREALFLQNMNLQVRRDCGGGWAEWSPPILGPSDLDAEDAVLTPGGQEV